MANTPQPPAPRELLERMRRLQTIKKTVKVLLLDDNSERIRSFLLHVSNDLNCPDRKQHPIQYSFEVAVLSKEQLDKVDHNQLISYVTEQCLGQDIVLTRLTMPFSLHTNACLPVAFGAVSAILSNKGSFKVAILIDKSDVTELFLSPMVDALSDKVLSDRIKIYSVESFITDKTQRWESWRAILSDLMGERPVG